MQGMRELNVRTINQPRSVWLLAILTLAILVGNANSQAIPTPPNRFEKNVQAYEAIYKSSPPPS